MPVITSKKRLTSKRKSYTLFLPLSLPSSKRQKEMDYNIKLKRIPDLAELTVTRVREAMLVDGVLIDCYKYTWSWYETEVP